MDKTKVIALLEKYWQAETTIEEEQALAAYFRGGQVDTELLPYVELFAYFREEARVSAGPDFGDRILQRLGLPTDTKQAGDASAAPAAAVPTAPVRHFRLGVIAAAAAILLVVAGVFLLKPAGGPAMLAEVHPNGHRTPAETRSAGVTRITDTYDDPQQALAAVRHALLIASHQLNQGRRQLAGARK